MGDGSRISSQGPAPQQSTTIITEVGAPSAPSTTENKKTQEDFDSTANTSNALKQQGTEVRSQQNIAGSLKQKELNQNLEKASQPVMFSANASKDQLSKINVQREKTEDGIRTTYPSGMTIETSGRVDKGKGITIEGGHMILAPPGGTLEIKEGRTIVKDAKGTEVATVIEDKNGSLRVYSKEGEYIESRDGKISFTKGKAAPKVDSDSPQREKTENGIRTTYPSGMTIETSGRVDKGKGITIEGGHMILAPPGGTLEIKEGRTIVKDAKGTEVATVIEDKNGSLRVYSKEGEYIESRDGKISFTKGKAAPKVDSDSPQREKTENGIRTTYPSGMTIETSGRVDKGKGITIEGGHVILAPPGGTLEIKSEGRTIVKDAKGEEVATVVEDKNGSLHVYTKQGEYVESPDGKIAFNKAKGDSAVPHNPPVK